MTDQWHELSTTIFGEPCPKGSPRVTKAGRTYPHKKSSDYIRNVAGQLEARWMSQPPLEGPLSVKAVVVLSRPKRLLRKKDPSGRVRHDRKPDIDNFAKSVLDAVTKAGVWVDDGQVCDLNMTKWYAAKGEAPRVELWIWRVE